MELGNIVDAVFLILRHTDNNDLKKPLLQSQIRLGGHKPRPQVPRSFQLHARKEGEPGKTIEHRARLCPYNNYYYMGACAC